MHDSDLTTEQLAFKDFKKRGFCFPNEWDFFHIYWGHGRKKPHSTACEKEEKPHAAPLGLRVALYISIYFGFLQRYHSDMMKECVDWTAWIPYHFFSSEEEFLLKNHKLTCKKSAIHFCLIVFREQALLNICTINHCHYQWEDFKMVEILEWGQQRVVSWLCLNLFLTVARCLFTKIHTLKMSEICGRLKDWL